MTAQARCSVPRPLLRAGVFLSLLSATALAEPNAQMKEVLDTYTTISPIPIEHATPAIAKAAPTISSAVRIVMKKEHKPAPPFTGSTKNFKIDTGNGNSVAARAYIPAGPGPFPTVLYIHGGGWVIGSIASYDSSPRALCEMTKAVVISTDYRHAPADKFPAAHDDTFGAYQWVLKNAGQFKGDPAKVALVGESAGGNMAAAICLQAKAHHLPVPVGQVLIYPVANYSFSTKSYLGNETTKPLSREGMRWFFRYYLPNPQAGNDPRISLLKAGSLKGLPPTTIIAAEIDPLLSEGQSLAEKLRSAGVPVTYRMYRGVTHEFFGMGAVVDEAKQAEALASRSLMAAFKM